MKSPHVLCHREITRRNTSTMKTPQKSVSLGESCPGPPAPGVSVTVWQGALD